MLHRKNYERRSKHKIKNVGTQQVNIYTSVQGLIWEAQKHNLKSKCNVNLRKIATNAENKINL